VAGYCGWREDDQCGQTVGSTGSAGIGRIRSMGNDQDQWEMIKISGK
jgi:hypothetical protein